MEQNLELAADYFYSLGLNIFTSSNKLNFHNALEKNIMKSPNHDWKVWINDRQTTKEINAFEWKDVTGIGLILGWDGILAIDIDGCLDKNLIGFILKKLGLPKEYEWTISSGSSSGYHIVVRTQKPTDYVEHLKKLDIPEEKKEFYDNIIYKDQIKNNTLITGLDHEHLFGTVDVDAYYCKGHFFNKIEFIWKGNLILPPSMHKSGRTYSFLGNTPKNRPEYVDFDKLLKLKDRICLERCNSSDVENFSDSDSKFKRFSNVPKFDIAHEDINEESFFLKHNRKRILFLRITPVEILNSPVNNQLYGVKFNWIVCNEELNCLKRNVEIFIDSKEPLMNFGYSDSHSLHLTMEYDEIIKICVPKKDLVNKLLIDCFFSNEFFFSTKSQLHCLSNFIFEMGIGFEFLAEKNVNFQYWHDLVKNFKPVITFFDNHHDDEKDELFNFKKIPFKFSDVDNFLAVCNSHFNWPDEQILGSAYELQIWYYLIKLSQKHSLSLIQGKEALEEFAIKYGLMIDVKC